MAETAGPAAPAGHRRRTVSLPDGRSISCTSSAEALFLWRCLATEGLYDGLAGALRPGDVVLDIGANIGLAAMKLHDSCPGIRVIAVEPAAPTFACLEDNLARHVPGSLAVRAAVADGARDQTFTYYPRAPGNSSLYPDRAADERARRAYLRNRGLPEASIDRFVAGADEGAPVTVAVVTVSGLLRDLGLDRVDAIKIDVERAELEVLRGIAPQHWQAVRHVAVEVHDERGGLARCRELIELAGLDVSVTQEPGAEGTGLYVIDARRRAAPAPRPSPGASTGHR
jgi:FkbM family methyltransferase